MATTSGVVLPCDSAVKHVEVDVPEPGHGQVLLQMKAYSICVGGALTLHLHPLAHGATAMTRTLTRRPARVV